MLTFLWNNTNVTLIWHFTEQKVTGRIVQRNGGEKKEAFWHMVPITGWKLKRTTIYITCKRNCCRQHFNNITSKNSLWFCGSLTRHTNSRFVIHLPRTTSVNTPFFFFFLVWHMLYVVLFHLLCCGLCGMWMDWSPSFLGIMWSLGKQRRTYVGWSMKSGDSA